MLNKLDGLDPMDGVLVIATANDASKLDVAILERPSRFDAKYFFDLPCEDLRRRFAKKWIQDKIGKDRLVWDAKEVADMDALLDSGALLFSKKSSSPICSQLPLRH